MSKLLTLRGKVTAGTTDNRLTLFDGRFDTAFRIKEITCAPAGSPSNNNDCSMILYTEEGAVTSNDWDWSDNRQIGWGLYLQAGTDTTFNEFNKYDRDAFIVEDLYIAAFSNKTEVNYEIVLEKVDISDWQGALAMVRNKSQG